MTTSSKRTTKRRNSIKKPNTVTTTFKVERPMKDVSKVHPVNGDPYQFTIIPRDAYYHDFRNRMNIHKYEVGLLGHDLKKCFTFSMDLVSELLNKVKKAAP